MASVREILDRLRNALSLSDPEWDVAVGTPEYRILEAVATEMDGVYNAGLLRDYHLNVDAKVGVELDAFTEMFGIHRLQAKRATGTVTLARGTPADVDYDIPAGAQLVKPSTSSSPSIVFQTTNAATLQTGQTQVQIPIEAVVAGTSGNVVAGSISLFGTATNGVTSVVNQDPTSGGRDIEPDDALRLRWKATVFRNVSGTADQFLALALDNPNVSRAVVLGPVVRVREQLQVVSGSVTSQITDAKYVYLGGGEFFGFNIGTADETLGVRYSDYNYLATNPPSVTILNSTLFPDGSIVDFEHEYTPLASRNDPANGVLHRVDIFITGQSSNTALEQITFERDAAHTFNATGGDPMNQTNWVRENETTQPTVGNYFVPLMNTPYITLPSTIVIGATTYTLNTDYWAIRDTTTVRGSARSNSGIEWRAAVAPTTGTVMVVSYTYNELIRTVDEIIKQLRLVGSDTMVHSAKQVNLRFHLSVVFNPTYSPAAETQNISSAVTNWLENKNFRGNVQISDLIDVVMNVPSVDNVRLTKSTENGTAHDIFRIARDGTTVIGTYTSDIYLASDEIPVLESIVVTPKAQNSF